MGYVMPLFQMAILKSAVCLAAAIFLGLDVSVHLLTTLLVLIPAALFFIGVGLLTGSIFNDKQVGGICGALLTNLSAWLSGTWFDLELVGGVFKKIAYALPFVHAVNAAQAGNRLRCGNAWHCNCGI
jgi:ABC-2 type transport system permease protein